MLVQIRFAGILALWIATCIHNSHSTIILEDKNLGTTCLLLNISAEFYVKNATSGIYESFSVNDSLPYFGDCTHNGTETSAHSNSILLSILVRNDTSQSALSYLEFNFMRGKGHNANGTFLMRVAYITIQGPQMLVVAENASLKWPLSPVGSAYECQVATEIPVVNNKSHLLLHEIKYQAYSIVNNTFSDTVVSCNGTQTTTTITTTESTLHSSHAMTTVAPSVIPTTTPALSDLPVFHVQDIATGHICLLLQFQATFRVPYVKMNGRTDIANVQFQSSGGQANGECGTDTQSISIQWQPSKMPDNATDATWELQLVFQKQTKIPEQGEPEVEVALRNITVVYYLEGQHFPSTKETGYREVSRTLETQSDQFRAPLNATYSCLTSKAINFQEELPGFGVDWTNVKWEVFRTSNDTHFNTADVWSCTEDRQINRIVPLVVGTSLVLLMLVVLVAYFISRRRHSANGYETMA